MATGTEGQEAKLNLGFEFDPKNMEAYLKGLQKIKGDTEETAQNLDGLQNAIKGFGGIVKGAAATIGGLFTFNQFIEAGELPKNFARVFGGIEAQAIKAAQRLRQAFGFSFEDAQLKLIGIQEQLKTLGIGKKTGLGISERILSGAAEVSNAFGVDFQRVLSAFQNFVTSGGKNNEELSRIFGKDKELLKLIFEHSEAVRISKHPTAAQTGEAAALVENLVKRHRGSIAKDPGLAFTQRDIKSNVADTFNAVIADLLPDMQSFAKSIRGVTSDMETLAPILAKLTKALGIIAAFTLAPKALGLLKKGLPGAALFAGLEVAERAKKGKENLEKGNVGFSLKGAGSRLLERFNVTNNNNVTINAGQADAKEVVKIVEGKIKEGSEKVFRDMNEREIPDNTSSEK